MQVADLLEANEALAGKLARLEHLLSRNSSNSSMPPSNADFRAVGWGKGQANS